MARKGLLKPTTRSWIEEARETPGYSFFDTLHGYVYARWPYFYIRVAKGEHPAARMLAPIVRWLAGVIWRDEPDDTNDRPSFADSYHGKVVPLKAAWPAISCSRPPITSWRWSVPAARAIPTPASRSTYASSWGSPLPDSSPSTTRAAPTGSRRRRLSTSCAPRMNAATPITPFSRMLCLAGCCGAMLAHRNGVPMLASSGYVCQVDADLCAACGTCTESCPFGALSMQNDVAAVDVEACMGCGVCVCQCAQGALSLVRDPAKGEPLEIQPLACAATAAPAR